MNIIKRVFNLKRLFALVMTIAMIFTLSVPGFTMAIQDQPVFSNPLVACYYIRTNSLTNIINGNMINMTDSSLKAKDYSFYAELVDEAGRKLYNLELPNGDIIVNANDLRLLSISNGAGLNNWLQLYSALFRTYFELGTGGLSLNVYASMENIQGEIVGTVKVAKIMLDTINDGAPDRDSDLMFNSPVSRLPQLRHNFDPAMNNEPEHQVDRNFSGNLNINRSRTDAPVCSNFDVDSSFDFNEGVTNKRARN